MGSGHATGVNTPPPSGSVVHPVVLVTGASSGVGLATAHRLARRGRRLALLARGEGPLESAADACRSLGAPWVGTFAVDVRDDHAVGAAVEGLLASQGRLDGVVSSAGVVAYGRLDELPAHLFDAVVATNLLGSANVLRHVLAPMRAGGAGSIVLIGSMIGHIAVPSMSAYTVSKWGVRALARQAALENRDVPGLHVSYVSLPGVDTPIYRQAAYTGGPAGQPPPLVWSADKAARVVVRVLERPRPVTHGGGVRRGHAVRVHRAPPGLRRLGRPTLRASSLRPFDAHSGSGGERHAQCTRGQPARRRARVGAASRVGDVRPFGDRPSVTRSRVLLRRRVPASRPL